MTIPPTTASSLAPPARGKTVTTEAKQRRKQSRERLAPSTQRAPRPPRAAITNQGTAGPGGGVQRYDGGARVQGCR
jgi:hypothetical protein